jgi:isopenicillin-N epimerase
MLCATLGVDAPAPDAMIGSLAAVPIADGSSASPTSGLCGDPLQDTLRERYGIEVPIIPWPQPPRRLLRISAQLYNTAADYDRLARALRECR